jgi:hypothetical protein
MKKGLRFLGWALVITLTFALVIMGCSSDDNGGGGGGPLFDGSTHKGTTWEYSSQDLEAKEGLAVRVKSTLKFTTDTEGTITTEVIKWIGEWNEMMQAMMTEAMAEDNGSFTYTYESTGNTGEYIMTDSQKTTTFKVDVGAKTLNSKDDDDEDEIVLQLK